MEKLEGSALYWSQLKATLIKNCLLKRREQRRTIAEVLLPLYTLGVLVLIKAVIPNPNFPPMDTPGQTHVSMFKDFRQWRNHTIAFVPNTTEVLAFLQRVDALWLQYQEEHTNHTDDVHHHHPPTTTAADNEEEPPSAQHQLRHAHHQSQRTKRFSMYYLSNKRKQRERSNQPRAIQWIGFASEEDLLKAYWQQPAHITVAVLFDDYEGPINGRLRYEVRTNPTYTNLPSTTIRYSSPANCREKSKQFIKDQMGDLFPLELGDNCPANQYLISGFVGLQTLLDYAKISLDTGAPLNMSMPTVQLQTMPKAAYTTRWIIAFRMIIPLYMVMSVSQFITYLLMLIIGEKENKIKEGMKMMGLRDSVFWLAWFIIYAVFVLWLSATASLVIYLLNVFEHTNMYLIFVLTFLYSLTVIMFAFMITPFFDKARTAGILGNFAVNIMSILYFLQIFLDDSGPAAFWAMSLVSSTGFALAMDKAIVLDLKGEGLTFANIWSTKEGGMPFAGSMIMMGVDVILYGALAYYLDSVIPSEHGIKRSPWFCFQPSFWRAAKAPSNMAAGNMNGCLHHEEKLINGSSPVTVANGNNGNGGNSGNDDNDVEPIPRELKGREAIRIVDLCKAFKKGKYKAVNGIDLTMYEGQITAILGHNGAGKTTLFNMLTGLTKPTSGTAYIFGYDIREPADLARLRSITGVCPQHDILFDCITPREHLEFFAAVKGIPQGNRREEVDRILADVDLLASAEVPSRYLSGGQKRKLSIGIAIIGDPKIIILDEPTAGVDPYSRRHMWSVLQKRKHGKVILLTTHFMDEADILADRKAVVSKGRVRCCGSSLFLKNKFGIGYHLTLVLEGACREHAIARLVTAHVPKAERARRHGRELSFILPHNAVDHFPSLFTALEQEIATRALRLGVSCYGVSMTTLEEVFLHLERDDQDGDEDGDADPEKDTQPVENMDNLSKKMVRNRALSRSLSLQSKSTSYQSLHNGDGIGDTDVEVAPSVGDEVNKTRLTSGGDGCNGLDAILEDRISSRADAGFSNAFAHVKCEPRAGDIYCALVTLRAVRIWRDIKKVCLMIGFPLLLTALSLYAHSKTSVHEELQVSMEMQTDVYKNESALAARNGSVDGVDVSGFAEHFSNLGGGKLRAYDGNYSQLLPMAPMLGAIDVGHLETTAMEFTLIYNDTLTHSLPILVNLLNNAVYRWLSGDRITRGSWKPIETSIRELPQTQQPEGLNVAVMITSFLMGLVVVIVPCNFAIELVNDRQIRAKNQLRVNGLGFGLYFVSFYSVIIVLLLITLGLLIGLVMVFDITAMREAPALVTLAALLAGCLPVSIMYNTAASYMFDRTDTAQAVMPNVCTTVGAFPFLIVVFLDMLKIGAETPFVLHTLFALTNPIYIPFAICYYVQRVHLMCQINLTCTKPTFADYLTDEVVVIIVGLVFHTGFYTALSWILDMLCSSGNFEEAIKMFKLRKKGDATDADDINATLTGGELGEHEDMDVRCERQKVASMLRDRSHLQSPPVVMVQDLHKSYNNRGTCLGRCCCNCCEPAAMRQPKVAIRSLSLAVDAGEVFGLLGHNGAGKTTTMKIITAEEAPTRGRVQIGGHSITSNLSDAFKVMGYCPQHDALWKNVTVREHLACYATIRGVPRAHRTQMIDAYLRGLQMAEHADKQASQCSGGTRRKLSFALASIGNPKVVLMDEPSTGMDPRSKRFLWDTILASFQGSRGAILTTHSMEEADALCSRVGIMVKGELRCLGSTQHLKNLYGAGYTLEVKHKGGEHTPTMVSSTIGGAVAEEHDTHAPLRRFVAELFPESKLVESFADRFVFSVPQRSVPSLANCFARLERAKQELDIVEYSFSQTTLEQVFLKFLSEEEQVEDRDEQQQHELLHE